MPYIKLTDRKLVDKYIQFISSLCNTTGNINYAITKFLHSIIEKNEPCYDMLNSIIGVLECAKLELYRQIAAPYEDQKKKENGPVSELDK